VDGLVDGRQRAVGEFAVDLQAEEMEMR